MEICSAGDGPISPGPGPAAGERLGEGIQSEGLASWKRPDGKENFYEWSAVSFKKGDRFYILGVDRDITDRKKEERELLAYQGKLRSLASVLKRRGRGPMLAENLHGGAHG